MRIPVPEMDERFECVKDALEHIIRLSSVIVEKAEKICPPPMVVGTGGRVLIDMLKGSPLTTWNYREFLFFKEHWMDVLNSRQLNLTSNEFLGARLQGYYQQLVFEHRNKTAHNTVSYMKDIPSLDTLADKGYVYKNYFFRFAILILIDEIIMRMFRKYRELGIGGF